MEKINLGINKMVFRKITKLLKKITKKNKNSTNNEYAKKTRKKKDIRRCY